MNIHEYISVGKHEKPLDRMVTDGGFCSIFRSLVCIGDSLSSGAFESMKPNGEKNYHDFYEYSWGQFIARNCGCQVYNFSMSGMTAKTYIEEFADKRGLWSKNMLAQAYIIALGVNDLICQNQVLGSVQDVDKENYKANKKTFAGYYASIIQKIKELQPRAKIFLVSMPKGGDKNDEIRKQTRDLLDDFTHLFSGTYLIDLYTYAPVNTGEYEKFFFLGRHLAPTGYVLTARMIESYIDYIIRKNPEDFKQVGFIGTDLYYRQEE